MLSRIIEVKELFDKKLLYDVRIEAVFYEMFGRTIRTDKWLGFQDWQQIYEKLDNILLACLSPNLDDLSLEEFRVSNSITVQIEKCPLKKAYWRLFSLSEKDLLPFFLLIKVARTDLAEVTKQLDELRASRKHSNQHKTKKCKIEIRRDLYPEYSPLPVSSRDRSKIPAYKPYKPSVKVDKLVSIQEDQHDNNEYCPEPISNSQPASEELSKDGSNTSTSNSGKKTVPTYIPSEIPKVSPSGTDDDVVRSSPTNISAESASNSRLDTRHCRNLRQRVLSNGASSKVSPEVSLSQSSENRIRKRKYAEELDGGKIKYSQELFGSDDSDKDIIKSEVKIFDSAETQESKDHIKEEKDNERSRRNRPCKNSEELKSKRSKKEEEKCPTGESKKKGKSSKAIKYEPCSTKSKSPEKEEIRMYEPHQKEMDILKACNDKLEALTRSPSPVAIMKLNHLKSKELLNTFDECKPMLDKHFREFRRQKGHVVKKMEDLNPLMTVNIINEEKSLTMMNHLKDIYETDTENVPCYTDLFMELMLPEWILAIFMKVYNMSRLEAVEHIIVQNQIDDSHGSLG